jgi:hypothetical protein
MRIVNRISGIEGVIASGSPRFKLPVNRRYHAIKLFCTLAGVAAAAATVVSRVRLYVNGVTVRDVPTSYLLSLAALNDITLAVGEILIAFSEPWRADKIDEVITAWDMFGENSFEVELIMTAGVAPGVTGIQIFDQGQTLLGGKVAKNITIRDPIQRIHLIAAGAINSMEVAADRNTVFEASAAQNTSILNDMEIVAQAGMFSICFDFPQRIDDALTAQRELNLRFDSAAANPWDNALAGILTTAVDTAGKIAVIDQTAKATNTVTAQQAAAAKSTAAATAAKPTNWTTIALIGGGALVVVLGLYLVLRRRV